MRMQMQMLMRVVMMMVITKECYNGDGDDDDHDDGLRISQSTDQVCTSTKSCTRHGQGMNKVKDSG